MYYYIMYIMGKIRRRYMNQIPENKDEYLKSRRASTAEGMAAMTITTLIGGTYLSGFLNDNGVSTTLNGLISAIPTIAGLIQPIGAVFALKRAKRKPIVTVGAITHRSLSSLMFFLPLFIKNPGMRIAAIVVMFALANATSAFISPASANWLASLTPQRVRGKYYSLREMYCLVTISVITLITGGILDYFKSKGNVTHGFYVIGGMCIAAAIINFISLSVMMEPESERISSKGESFIKTAKAVFTETSFRPVLLVCMLYNFGVHVMLPYWGIYLVGEMELSYSFISIISLAAIVVKALSVRRWGRYADKTSWTVVTKLSIGIIAVSHLASVFVVPSTKYVLYPLTTTISNFGWAAIGISIQNLQFDYAPAQGRTMYIGVCAALTGVAGFIGALVGGLMLGAVTRLKPTIFGVQIRGQQVLMLASGILLLLCVLYIKKVLEKNKKIINKSDGSRIKPSTQNGN